MKDYADFLCRWQEFAAERSIPWAVIGSHAIAAQARVAGIEPRREPYDLDLIACLPRRFDDELRQWADRRTQWVYEQRNLGAIHFWCDNRKQIDLFVHSSTAEIGRAVPGNIFGVSCLIVGVEDLLAAAERWARDTKDPHDVKHHDQQKYQADAEWIKNILMPRLEAGNTQS